MKSIVLKHLKQQLEHMQMYNTLGPFPCYDTDYVKDVENKVKEMEENGFNYDYDSEPVVACRHCKSLHIINDEYDNAHCYRCSSTNELQVYKNIHEYLKFKNKEE